MAFLCCAGAAAAQTPAESIADLARPERAVAACSALQQQGIAAVWPLRHLLQQSRRDDAAIDPTQLSLALYVLGRLGDKAVTALPEVRQIYRDRGPSGLRNQALWALGELALATRDSETCRDAAKLLDDQWTEDLDGFLGMVVARQLELGPWPSQQQLLQALRQHGSDRVIAASRAVASGRVTGVGLVQPLWELLVAALDDAALPGCVRPAWSAAAGDLAVALADGCARGDDPIVLRGLLRFWDPDRRRIALAKLIEHPDLPALERADVGPLLFDPGRAVRLQAARTLRSWGRVGLPGLLGLRAAQTGAAGDREFEGACREAAEAILTGARAQLTGKIGQALLAELDGIARGGGPAEEFAFDAEATWIWVEVMAGARAAPAATCQALLQLGQRRMLRGEEAARVTAAAVGSCEREVVVAGMALLARLGPKVEDVVPLDRLLYGVVRESLGDMTATAFEGKAWVDAGPAATLPQLRAALSHGMVRVQLRAIVELAGRGELPTSRQLAALPLHRGQDEAGWLSGGNGACYRDDASWAPARQLILGLCGADGSDTASFQELVAERFEVPLAKVPAWLVEERRAGRLHERLLEVEAMLRRDLQIDERIVPR